MRYKTNIVEKHLKELTISNLYLYELSFISFRQWGRVPFSKKFSGLHYLMPDSPIFSLIQQKFDQLYKGKFKSFKNRKEQKHDS